MKTKFFSLPIGLLFLSIAGIMTVLAPPMAAQAADPAIEWIRIYLNPTFFADDGLPYSRNLDGFPEYVHTDSNGVPIGATEVTSTTQTARWNDVIAIAIRLNDVNLVYADLEALTGWATAGTGSTIKTTRLKPNRTLESAANTAITSADQSFTVVYLYRVRAGDSDTDGGWLPNNSPFDRWRVSSSTSNNRFWHTQLNSADQLTALTYANHSSIVYPQVDGTVPAPTVTAIKFYKEPTVWSRYSTGRTPIVLKGESSEGGHPTGVEITEADPSFKVGQVIGIAVTLTDVTTASPRLTLSFDEGPSALDIRGRAGADQPTADGGTDRTPSELWPGDGTHQASFVMYYGYRVQAGDLDLDGGWFHLDAGAIVPFSSNVGAVRGSNSVWYRTGAGNMPLNNIKLDAALVSSIVWPKIDGIAPTIATDTTRHRLEIALPPAGQSGKSRYHEVRQTCLEDHGTFGDAYINACRHVEAPGWSTVALDDVTHEAAYYKADDEVEVTVRFSEPVVVSTDPAKQPTFYISGDGYKAELKYTSGSESASLTFALRVTEGQHTFGGLQVWSEAFWRNTHTVSCQRDYDARLETDEVRWIRDLSGNDFETCVSLEKELAAFFTGMRDLEKLEYANPHPNYRDDNKTGIVAAFKKGIIKHLVDTIPATVWVPGLIKNGETHTDDKRHAAINLDESWAAEPLTDLALDITEGTTQSAAFDVEFRFFNHYSANEVIADEVGTSFIGDDVDITGENVVRDEWDVEIAYVGLDHRATNAWPPPNHWSGRAQGTLHSPGDAKNSGSFLVYKATITPALGFQGDVAISLPAGATEDIAGNASLASNTLTVPVNIPFQVVETPEIIEPAAGVYTAGEKIAVEVTYNREGLRYEGENPPYLTLYLGEEVPANARHATWQAAADANSTKVTFAYTVAVTDVADSVSVAPVGLTVPAGTRVVDDAGSQLLGTGEQAKKSGEGLETMPPPGQRQFDRDLPPRTEVLVNQIYVIFDESDPKAVASDVPREPIVFNELGNGSGDTDDWLELRNVTGDAVSLKEWELSVVQDGKKEDTSLIVFGDVSVPANGLLLVTNQPSDKTPLAGGAKKGLSHASLDNVGLSLPDDGKFLLILRKAREKLGLNEAFIDVAGGGGSDTDAFVREQTGDYDTHVWPLQVLQAPGGDTEDALSSGKVWMRANEKIVGYHKDAWAEASFTGIGYDRSVSESAATAGTPGYPNGAAKETTAEGSVTLSEIMFDSGGGTLPQWIELYNNSKTEAINLNRWKLEIQNVDSEELDGRPIVTLTLQAKVIQPNQTLLIVAGPARASSDSYLPADRVYDLLALHEKNLRIKSARETFLSAEGFYLKLTDRNEQLVDEVGNTDGHRRTKAAPAWTLPLSAEAGVRSSLIRRYTDGTSVAKDGMERGNWVLAANVKKVVAGGLHWGDADDIGTPGYRKGGALPVELSSFSLTRTEAGAVVLTWTTESEVDNAGFNLRRSEQRASGFTLLNPALIAGAGTTGERQTYAFTDTSAKPGVEYYYQIEEVAFNGRPATLVTRLLPGPVSAANRMLTTFGEVKQRD